MQINFVLHYDDMCSMHAAKMLSAYVQVGVLIGTALHCCTFPLFSSVRRKQTVVRILSFNVFTGLNFCLMCISKFKGYKEVTSTANTARDCCLV